MGYSFPSIFGVMEYWSDGVMVKMWMSFFNSTPVLQCSRVNTLKKAKDPRYRLFIGYSYVKICVQMHRFIKNRSYL